MQNNLIFYLIEIVFIRAIYESSRVRKGYYDIGSMCDSITTGRGCMYNLDGIGSRYIVLIGHNLIR